MEGGGLRSPRSWREQQEEQQRRGVRRVIRTLAVTVFVMLFVVAGGVFGAFYFGSRTIRDALWKHIRENPFQNPMALYTPERQFAGVRSMNILVLGVDRDLDNRRRVMKTNGRSDSILIARVDLAGKTIRALTIPRDTAVHIPGRRGLSKINAAHSFGGPELTIDTIRECFGIPIDHYVTINFDGFCKVVDAIGGVDLTVEKRLKYDDNWGGLHINLYPGYQHLNGYQAMGYVRMRHSDSDEMRSKRQHAFLEAVRTKLKSPATFLRLPGAVDRLADSLKRSPNLTLEQMFALANFARGLPKDRIEVVTLPSEEGRSYVSVNRTDAEALINRLFFPGSASGVRLDVPDPSTVAALNGEYRRHRTRRSSGNAGVNGDSGASDSSGDPSNVDGLSDPDTADGVSSGENGMSDHTDNPPSTDPTPMNHDPQEEPPHASDQP